MRGELPNGEIFYASPRYSSRAASAELRNNHRSGAHYSHWPDNGIRCVSARLPRAPLAVRRSGHQDFRDAMPIYISHGRFQAASACATSFEVTTDRRNVASVRRGLLIDLRRLFMIVPPGLGDATRVAWFCRWSVEHIPIGEPV